MMAGVMDAGTVSGPGKRGQVQGYANAIAKAQAQQKPFQPTPRAASSEEDAPRRTRAHDEITSNHCTTP